MILVSLKRLRDDSAAMIAFALVGVRELTFENARRAQRIAAYDALYTSTQSCSVFSLCRVTVSTRPAKASTGWSCRRVSPARLAACS